MKIYLPILCIIMAISHFSFTTNEAEPIVVIELFTSQGCSSCPAADKLLNDIITKAENENQPVIGLSYHVSYWNHLGWKDPYSSDAYNALQRNYSAALQSSVYTPQMIVNGRQEFIGSDGSKANELIKEALIQRQSTAIALSDPAHHEKELTVNYKVTRKSPDQQLIVLLVKKHVENQVPRGENQGRLLKHDNVVIYREQILLSDQGIISLPEAVVKESNSIVVYIQDAKTLTITSAARMKL